MKSKIKYLLSVIFLAIILILTFNSIFNDQSLTNFINNIQKINILYIFISLLIILLYFSLQGLYMKIILHSMNKKISLKKGIFYSLTEFFYSGITPSSTGGQPVQLYYMTKDNIPTRKTFITLVLNALYFKIIILFLCIIVLLFNNGYIFNQSTIFLIAFIIGFIIDLLIVLFCLLLLFKKSIIKKILILLYKIGSKIKPLKQRFSNYDKIDESLNNYNSEIRYIKNHKKEVIIGFIITFIQRLLLFSIAYVIYCSLKLNKYSYFDLLAIQAGIQMAIEFLPLPGGAGFSENVMNTSYIAIFGVNLATTGMILTRLFSFYLPLIISGLILLIDYIKKICNIFKQ